MSRIGMKHPLVKVAILGSITVSSVSILLQRSIEDKMKNTSSYQEAMKILRSEEIPRQYLGEPIVEKSLNFLSSNSYGTKGKWRWVMFGVEGPINKGYFKYWFSSDDDGHHRLLRVELSDTDEKNVFDKFVTPKKEQ